MTTIEQSRLEDFKKILTFHLVSKIHYSRGFNNDYKAYYQAPKIWNMWKDGKVKYVKMIFKYIALFNSTALTTIQVRSIFGKDENNKWISYENILKNDPDIKQFNKGTIVIKNVRHQITKRYQLPFEFIKNIFENKQLLEKVLNAKSDYYTKRQTKLIFNQILKKKKKPITKTEQLCIKEIVDEL